MKIITPARSQPQRAAFYLESRRLRWPQLSATIAVRPVGSTFGWSEDCVLTPDELEIRGARTEV